MEQLNTILKQIEKSGGKCFYVGGSVRDYLLGISVYDYDIEVYNMDFYLLVDALSSFGELIVNKDFYTIKIKRFSNYEFSVPRIEINSGIKHSDFNVSIIGNNDYVLAAKRRDFTVNSMLMAFGANDIIDNYNGRQALDKRVLRHVSDKFNEDSLRVLRGLRFSAKLGFTFDEETYKLCVTMVKNIDAISDDRFSSEILKMLEGKYFDIAIGYFIELFKDYFRIDNYNIKKLKELVQCDNIKIRTLLTFKNIETENVEYMIKRCITTKKLRDDILLIIKTKFETIEDFYLLAQKYSEEEVKLLYKYINNQDVSSIYSLYLYLKNKYTAHYVISMGYSGADISKQIKMNILNDLKEGEFYGFSKSITRL